MKTITKKASIISDYFSISKHEAKTIMSNISSRNFIETILNADYDEAYPVYQDGYSVKDYEQPSIEFIKKHYEKLSGLTFQTKSYWGDYDKEKKIIPYVTESFYASNKAL